VTLTEIGIHEVRGCICTARFERALLVHNVNIYRSGQVGVGTLYWCLAYAYDARRSSTFAAHEFTTSSTQRKVQLSRVQQRAKKINFTLLPLFLIVHR
jgi:hypothetical protein